MSFSSDVKTELAEHTGKARHCRLAELAAFVYFGCKLEGDCLKTNSLTSFN